MIITELPVGEWTSDYKEFLEKLLEDEPEKKNPKTKKVIKKKDKPFLGYTDNNTHVKVYFELEFEDGYLETAKDIEKTFKLVKKVSIGNMHLYNKDGAITRYDTIEAILNDYYEVRLDLYQKRKDNKLETLESQLKIISYKVKFILLIVEKKLDINNKKKSEIEVKLEELKFPRHENSYNYLLSMPLYNLTYEKIEELKKQEKEKQTEFDTLIGMKPEDLWKKDLDEFEQAYDKWMEVKNEKSKGEAKKIRKLKKSTT